MAFAGKEIVFYSTFITYKLLIKLIHNLKKYIFYIYQLTCAPKVHASVIYKILSEYVLSLIN